MPKNSISSRASQKEGMAKPRKTSTVTPRSSSEFCLQAERMPTGMAMSSVSVVGNSLRLKRAKLHKEKTDKNNLL